MPTKITPPKPQRAIPTPLLEIPAISQLCQLGLNMAILILLIIGFMVEVVKWPLALIDRSIVRGLVGIAIIGKNFVK